MRLHHYTTILLFCLAFCLTVSAQEAPAAGTDSMHTKLERTRQLMQETPAPNEGTVAAKQVQESEMSATGMKMVQSLGFLVALVLIGAWGYKKFVLKEAVLPTRKMKLVERITLSPRASLVLAEVDGTKILVGMTPDSISMMKMDSTPAPFAVTLEKEYEGQ